MYQAEQHAAQHFVPMPPKNPAKQERVVETVRRGLSGEAAVDFVRQSGYAITETAIARAIQNMGGRGRIQQLIDEGKNNVEILHLAFPTSNAEDVGTGSGRRPEAWSGPAPEGNTLLRPEDHPLYETAKMTVHLPADVYEAVRLAARAENKTQNQLIVDLLTKALSQIPRPNLPETEE
jgi:hypothetical protein